ncbi:MAG: hypothetical protein HYZ46_03640 [Nitrosomonadales bacterium]|nr:hypothetical protein [Nitrosomonadales bacterium]
MLYPEEFIDFVKSEPINGTIRICQKAISAVQENKGYNAESFEMLLEAYALLLEMKDANLLPISFDFPSISGKSNTDYVHIHNALERIAAQCSEEASKLRLKFFRSRFHSSLGTDFVYEFSQGDLKRVQELINDLREKIAATKQLEPEHQQRLLRRLEKLQAEMHKKISDLDRFWGLVGDAGVVMGKLGKDAKPIVDRIREIADIVWQTQSRAEELPSGTSLPILEDKQQSDGE